MDGAPAAALAAGEQIKKLVVLYPSAGMGHLVSMLELAKLFISHGFAVTVVVVDTPIYTGGTAAFLAESAAKNPSISFHRLPPVDVPSSTSPHFEAVIFDRMRRCNPHFAAFLHTAHADAVVLDFFCACAVDVAVAAGVPAYFFFTSPAAVLAVFLHLPVLHETYTNPLRELRGDHRLQFPGVPAIPADHMIRPLLDRDDSYDGFLDFAVRYAGARGVIINTFRSLEPRAVAALADGSYNPNSAFVPSVHCIGPLIKTRTEAGGEACIRWLDKQPEKSVVFLCFGSTGQFSAEQIKEVATGLEMSGHRFLWVVRTPPSGDRAAARHGKLPEPHLDALLPKGFLARTEEKGMVVPSWAPQTVVLEHGATAAFVTHCGWNSVLEAVVAGVPMVCWPLYAEQRMNKIFLVEELRLATAVEGYVDGMVPAAEVCKKVKSVMESQEGKEMRERTSQLLSAARAATADGGESSRELEELLKGWKLSSCS